MRRGARAEELRLLEAMLFAVGRAARREDAGGAAAAGRRRARGARAPAGGVRAARRQPRAHRRQMDLPHRRTISSWLLSKEAVETRKLSRAAIETLAIIAYHQPVTRAEIEDIRGVTHLEGLGRRAAGDRLDPPARPAQGARPAADLRHHARRSCRISGSTRSAICRGSKSSRAPACSTAGCRPASRCRCRRTIRRLRDDEDPLEPGDLDLGLAPPPERTARSELRVVIAAKGRRSSSA